MTKACAECPFSYDDVPCEPTESDWEGLTIRDQGAAAVRVGRCMQRRKNTDARTDLDTFESMRNRIAERFTHPPRRGESVLSREGSVTSPLLVGFIDGDNFGQINKQYGHLVGDKVIKAMAQHIRGSDFCARRGSQADEFAFAMFGLTLEQAYNKIVEARMTFKNGGMIPGTHERWTAMTVGAYVEDPRRIEDFDCALNVADMAIGAWKRGPRTDDPVPLLLTFGHQPPLLS